MHEFISHKPDISVKEEEYKRLLGFPPGYNFKGRSAELAEWARQWYDKNGNPWIYGIRVSNISLSEDKICLNGRELISGQLQHQFSRAGVDSAVLVAVSAGKECEEMAGKLWLEEKPDEYFFLEIYGSAVVEHLIAMAGFRLCDWGEKNNLAVLPHYSPGYTGWNIKDQHQLWKILIEEKQKSLPGEFRVLESGMLKPKKSMLALFGITKEIRRVVNIKELIPCENCSLVLCNYRRVPYKYIRRQPENVEDLQKQNTHKMENNILIKDVPYTVNIKALQKWSQERLHLKIFDDTSVEARFSYEGTTCSNMGRMLKFDYLIRTGSASEGYKLLSLDCRPSPDDDGYTYMCDYISDSDSLMGLIENEKPLLGKPLNEVLAWKRQFSPEGCYCKAESREHKWGLVLEVLHYALSRRND